MNDPAAQMGLQMGQSAMKVGQEYVEQNVRHVARHELSTPAMARAFHTC